MSNSDDDKSNGLTELANSICTLATICNLLSLMYIATPEQPASYLFITRTSHLNHTRLQNAPHTTHKSRVLLLNARTQPSFDQADDGVDAETSLSLCISISLLRSYTFFSRSPLVSKTLFENGLTDENHVCQRMLSQRAQLCATPPKTGRISKTINISLH